MDSNHKSKVDKKSSGDADFDNTIQKFFPQKKAPKMVEKEIYSDTVKGKVLYQSATNSERRKSNLNKEIRRVFSEKPFFVTTLPLEIPSTLMKPESEQYK